MTDNIWYYLVIFIISYMVIQNIDLDIRTCISLFVSICCVYFLYIYSNKNSISKSVNKKYDKINKEVELLDLLDEIKFMKSVNRPVYKDILRYLNNFLNIRSEMTKGDKYKFQLMVDERGKALNSLASLMITCPSNNDRVLENKILKNTELIRQKLDNILTLVQLQINNNWDKGEIDVNGGEVYMDIPKGVDYLSNNNYDIIN